MTLFQVGWPKDFILPFVLFWPHLKLVGLKKFVWPFELFTLKKLPLQKNIYYAFFSATRLKNSVIMLY